MGIVRIFYLKSIDSALDLAQEELHPQVNCLVSLILSFFILRMILEKMVFPALKFC